MNLSSTELLGCAVIAFFLFRICHSLYNIVYPFWIARRLELRRLAGAPWAVVTGSTDGIGKAYAKELARHNFNILLISRSSQKLLDTMTEFTSEFPKIRVSTFTFDFSTGSQHDYEPLHAELELYEIGILVNNVGSCFDFPEPLLEVGTEVAGNVTIINTLPAVMMSRAVLPRMVSRRSGVIVNMSSITGHTPTHLWNVYSSTKQFLMHFSRTLHAEYAGSGLTIQTLYPSFISTNMTKNIDGGPFVTDVAEYVASAVKTIGVAAETSGHPFHQLETEILLFIPFDLRVWILHQLAPIFNVITNIIDMA